jgi:hypothetical protein
LDAFVQEGWEMHIQMGRSKVHSIKAGVLLIALALPLSAQQAHGPDIRAQRDAMQKLGFLVGRWSGPVSVTRGPGELLKLTQAENVQLKLDGLVMLIEGQSTGQTASRNFRPWRRSRTTMRRVRTAFARITADVIWTDLTFGSSSAQRNVEMLLKREP